ncbi:hypothetical protein [Ensifer soli]|uniref:hypothetical protein n=1 Tax=Ciceribacter sp. sgz301302 TaxID=3342379 RepID=UPI0035B6BF20
MSGKLLVDDALAVTSQIGQFCGELLLMLRALAPAVLPKIVGGKTFSTNDSLLMPRFPLDPLHQFLVSKQVMTLVCGAEIGAGDVPLIFPSTISPSCSPFRVSLWTAEGLLPVAFARSL